MPRDESEAPQRAQQEAEEVLAETDPRGRLLQLLAPHIELLQMGIPAREVEALIRTDEPRFSAKKLGFEDFTALLDFAEAEELLRSIPDDRNVLRFKPGDSLTVAAEEETPAAEDAPAVETGSAPRRRRRRRNASRRRADDEGDSDVSAAPAQATEEATPVESGAKEPAPSKKKAAKRKTAKKSAKKSTRKKAAKKADDAGGDEATL
jgi:hypothetical protein